jgi:hypothetical protein
MYTSRTVIWLILGGLALTLIALAQVQTGDVAANGVPNAPPWQPALLQGRPTLTPSPIPRATPTAKPKPRSTATPSPTPPASPTPMSLPTVEAPAAPTATLRPERLPTTAEPAAVPPLVLLAIAAATLLLTGHAFTRRQ